MKYAVIEANRHDHKVARLCEVMEVSRSDTTAGEDAAKTLGSGLALQHLHISIAYSAFCQNSADCRVMDAEEDRNFFLGECSRRISCDNRAVAIWSDGSIVSQRLGDSAALQSSDLGVDVCIIDEPRLEGIIAE